MRVVQYILYLPILMVVLKVDYAFIRTECRVYPLLILPDMYGDLTPKHTQDAEVVKECIRKFFLF
jgi:hypothetical protein